MKLSKALKTFNPKTKENEFEFKADLKKIVKQFGDTEIDKINMFMLKKYVIYLMEEFEMELRGFERYIASMLIEKRLKQEKKDKIARTNPKLYLTNELKYYSSLKKNLLKKHEGKFALIKGKKLIGIFDTFEVSLETGYQKLGNQPFLIEPIVKNKPVVNIL